MNKTVNINLAGTFFHIDENAYQKLQRYLEAIKRSFTDSQGRNEIIADIETRIAELFNERVENDKQVVSIKEVDEVITIMGQPEDYIVDEEIFEDEPKQSYKSSRTDTTRKLYRDTENAYIGGVSSGLSHYFGIEPLWIRLIWVLLFFGAGTGILVYILLWILMPAAETTSEKLAMSGKPVNITNIEEKVKEGFSNVKESLDGVADRISNADYDGVSNKVKHKSRSFFDALGNVIMFFFKIFAKFIGIILIIVGATTLISLIVSLLSVGVVDIFNFDGIDMAHTFYSSNLPIWVVSLLVLFAVGIPFFFIFILGLKILVDNLKSLGKTANFTLFGLWLASIVTLAIFAAREVAEFSREGEFTETIELNVKANDTLFVEMVNNEKYASNKYRSNDFDIVFDGNNKKQIYSSDVRFLVKSTKDSIAYMEIVKDARGRTYQDARDRAEEIDYNFDYTNGKLALDNYFLTDADNKFRNQDVTIILYMPEGSVIYSDKSTRNKRSWRLGSDIISRGKENHFLKIKYNDIECLDCEEEDSIIEIKDDEGSLEIDSDKIEYKDGEVKATIDSSGITIKSTDN
ncbi:PspC domain-containing protein [Flavobacteriaceae bacterium S0825]|uniref:PspC domain-containing protein n=1 Tax=Gaetbulibacter sp. S0825 TaxID=2720084 RepID=UPI00142FE612|nr:PspC domain-containing protein [Gaetbulibacter sp. S0825]MCK0110073.1 PspC domain-containing protein [Flavobacteriaceae bacterium S0825]NIX65702.1 PspC domain-containing protein [Gaetbulibacter sp. S0825]